MKRFLGLNCVILFACLLISTAYGDYLEARRSTDIKAEPDRDAKAIENVEPGARLKLLDEGRQTNGYYCVQPISSDEPGWIYRTFVRRHHGEIAEQPPKGGTGDPFADPTLKLTAKERRYALRHLRLGKPQAVYERVREGYVLAQDARLKIPLWVQYELTKDDLRGKESRTENFRPDTSVPSGSRAELADYRDSGFDRGHMAPAADMKRKDNTMSDSFLLSNMCPQVGIGFNRDIWQELEAAVRGWVEQRGALTVITGPIFAVDSNAVTYKVIGQNHVAVPTHFYKIIVDASNSKKVEALAFIMPNEDLSGHQYTEYLCAIDEIEKATGLDFLSALPAAVEDAVESHKSTQVW